METQKITDKQNIELIKSHLFEDLSVLKSIRLRTYPLSKLLILNWDSLEELWYFWGLDKNTFLERKLYEDKDNVVLLLRKIMREYELKEKIKDRGK